MVRLQRALMDVFLNLVKTGSVKIRGALEKQPWPHVLEFIEREPAAAAAAAAAAALAGRRMAWTLLP